MQIKDNLIIASRVIILVISSLLAISETSAQLNIEEKIIEVPEISSHLKKDYYHLDSTGIYLVSSKNNIHYLTKMDIHGTVAFQDELPISGATKLIVDRVTKEIIIQESNCSYLIVSENGEMIKKENIACGNLMASNNGVRYYAKTYFFTSPFSYMVELHSIRNDENSELLNSISDNIEFEYPESDPFAGIIQYSKSGESYFDVKYFFGVESDETYGDRDGIGIVRFDWNGNILQYDEVYDYDDPVGEYTSNDLFYGHSGSKYVYSENDALVIGHYDCTSINFGSCLFGCGKQSRQFGELTEKYTLFGYQIRNCNNIVHAFDNLSEVGVDIYKYKHSIAHSGIMYQLIDSKLYVLRFNLQDEDMDGFDVVEDCNDQDSLINPMVVEIPNNEIDENCDDIIEIDMDLDGYSSLIDCNDQDSLINPGVVEIANNEVDENCDGIIEIDMDLDGYLAEVDCDDQNSSINPGTIELVFNGLDDDCNELTLDTYPSCIVVGDVNLSILDEYISFQESYNNCNIIIEGNLTINSFNIDSIELDMIYAVTGDISFVYKDYISLPTLRYASNITINNDVKYLDLNNLFEVESLNVIYTDLKTLRLPTLTKVNRLLLQFNDVLEEIELYDSLIINDYLSVAKNEILSNCSLEPICEYLNAGGESYFGDNNGKCNSEEEILIRCFDFDNDGFGHLEDCNNEDPLIYPDAPEVFNNDIDENCDGINEVDNDLDGYGELSDCNDQDGSVNPLMDEILFNGIDDDCNSWTPDDSDVCIIEENVALNTVEEYNNFVVTYEECNVIIEGDLFSEFAQDIFRMEMLVEIRGKLEIRNKSQVVLENLTKLEGNSYLRTFESINLSNLQNAHQIDVSNGSNNTLKISFPNLLTVYDLEIRYNQSLTEVDLNDELLIENKLTIRNNSELSMCSINSICNHLSSNGNAYIRFNNTNCDSEEEILNKCYDTDNDGYGLLLDCDNLNPLINPGEIEIFGNDVDENCDGIADVDVDLDGYGAVDDCDDFDPLVNPSVQEILFNGIDDDCTISTPDDSNECWIPGDVNLNSQEEYESFVSKYEHCELYITGTLISNFIQDSFILNMIVEVGNSVSIRGKNHISLSNIKAIDGIYTIIETQKSLNLIKLERAIGLNIFRSDSLEQIDLPNLTELEELEVSSNTNLSGLNFNDDLIITYLIHVENNPNLSNCSVNAICNSLNSIEFDISFSNNKDGCNSVNEVFAICTDTDNDGYGSDIDCNNQDSLINPGAIEIPNNDIDENCDGIAAIDIDMDGYYFDDDCDDNNPFINPGATEIHNNDIDENCDGIIGIDIDLDGYGAYEDCNDQDASINPGMEEIPNNDIDENCDYIIGIDSDLDGFTILQDCNDEDSSINPNATEIPNNDIDENCDGFIEIDMDLDGYLAEEDCNDLDASINPGMEEMPNNDIDENCDGLIEIDMDLDGYLAEEDCNDLDASINPGMEEIINNDIDENCDGLIEIDMDLDGYLVEEDCDDLDPLVNPGAIEITYNGKDDDCNEMTLDDDLDQDGFPLTEDCDDQDININPQAIEIPNNDVDEDCDGFDLVTSTTDQFANNVRVYPNPASNYFIVESEINGRMSLFNIYGYKIHSQHLVVGKQTINVNSFDSGIYFLEVQKDHKQNVYRIVINN